MSDSENKQVIKLNRTQNAISGIIWGFLNKIINLLLPFFVRILLIKYIGIEYLGINGLFTSVLHVLSLAELGFGNAIVYSMYKPIANNETSTIRALLNYYKTIYRTIGFIISVMGILIVPFLKYFIKGAIPNDVNLYVLYFIFLFNTVISYFLFAYKQSLLSAFQRYDVISNVNTFSKIIMYLLQILFIIKTNNYYWYIIFLPLSTIVINIINYLCANKMYPEYNCEGEITIKEKKEIRKQAVGLLTGNICGVFRESFDVIFISSMFGLKSVAVYSNYLYVIMSVKGLLNIITSSMQAGIGNSVASESVEKNYSDFNKFNFFYLWITGICLAVLMCCYQTFMDIWVTQDNMLPDNTMLLFCLYFLLLAVGDIRALYHGAKGMWWYTKEASLAESIVNLILNIVLGKLLGVFGILLATVISVLFVGLIFVSRIVFLHYFGIQKLRRFYLDTFVYIVVIFVIGRTSFYITNMMFTQVNIPMLFLRALFASFYSGILFFLVFFKKKERKELSVFLKINLKFWR